ncbi:MAG: hypothetical protein LAT62_07050 [Natronospirillum sp.]|uniref:hypothetical protein n=1 Tax=Natronospirillum sp. TaxID=2812955 RepID=UPI0025E5137C|nr:hypothetical protein [Natronospirillum sp.]MCH8551674.1 hypothetical protein [Natronospirillum sp.]
MTIKIAASVGGVLILALAVTELFPVYQVARHSQQALLDCGEGGVKRVNTTGFECAPTEQ